MNEKERLRRLGPAKPRLLSFANALMKAKNRLVPEFLPGSPAYPFLAECEMTIDKAIKKLIKQVEEL